MSWLISFGIVLGISILFYLFFWVADYLKYHYPVMTEKIAMMIFLGILLFIFTVLVHQLIWG